MLTIYAMQNTVNKKMYIGSSGDVLQRIKSHLNSLKCGKHPIEDMQNDYDKYGEVFKFYILEEDVHCDERIKEYKYMKKYKTHLREFGYNYKDRYAAYVIHDKPRKEDLIIESVGTIDDILPEDNPTKAKYISKIVEILNKTDDITLLDLIHKMLQKSE